MASGPSSLQYSFTLAWSIHGGLTLPDSTKRLNIVINSNKQVYFCTEISDDLRDAISLKALGTALQRKRFCSNEDTLGNIHKQAVDKLTKEIEDKSKDCVIICYHSSGSFCGDIDFKRCYCDADACLCHDAFDDSALVEQAQAEMRMAKLALSREFKGGLEYQHLIDAFEYKDSHGRPYFQFKINFLPGKAYGGRCVDSEFARNTSEFLGSARGSSAVKDMSLPLALFSTVSRVNEDPLLAFVAGWAALDTLVEEAETAIRPKDIPKKQWRCQIINLIKKSNCIHQEKAEKSPFLQRFAAVARDLFEKDSEEDVCATISECWGEYQKRNSLYHDGDNVSSPPSIDFLSRTLAKFLYAFLDRENMRKRG